MQEIKTPAIKAMLPFVAAKNYPEARQFYTDLGFEETWYSEGMASFKLGDFHFYLQNFYVKDWAENSVLFVVVENVADWWAYLQKLQLSNKYPTVRLIPPKTEDWGTECMLIDPSGVLWHFGKYADN